MSDRSRSCQSPFLKSQRFVYLELYCASEGALAGAGLLIGFVSFFVWPPSGFARRPSTEPTVERHVEAVSTKRRPWHEETRKENDMKVPLSPKKKSKGGRRLRESPPRSGLVGMAGQDEGEADKGALGKETSSFVDWVLSFIEDRAVRSFPEVRQ